MSFEFEGLTEMQNALLDVAQRRLPKETKKVMRKAGSKMRVYVKRRAKSEKIGVKNEIYHKKFKRGKVFKNDRGEWVVRVVNSAPHAHLIEHGHKQVVQKGRTRKSDGRYIAYRRAGQQVGYVPGKKVMEKGSRDFENSGQYDEILGKWLDDLLKDGKL